MWHLQYFLRLHIYLYLGQCIVFSDITASVRAAVLLWAMFIISPRIAWWLSGFCRLYFIGVVHCIFIAVGTMLFAVFRIDNCSFASFLS